MRAEWISLGAVFLSLTACGTLENMGQTLDIQVDGPVMRMDGIINSQSLGNFVDVLDDNPGVTTVELGRIEGSLDGEVVAEMGYIIRDAGLATRMRGSSQVFSGGVDLFLGGVDRRVAPGAIVGVHEWETGFGRARDFARDDPAHEPTRGYIEDMLGTDAFYWFTLEAAAFDEVHVMSRQEMLRYGVVTQ